MYKETCDDSIEDNQAKIFSETADSIEDNQAKIFSETADDYPSGKNSNPGVFDESRSGSDSEREINVISRGDDTHINGTKIISSSAGRSSSSSSSESLSNDFFQMEEPFKFPESSASTPTSRSGKDSVSSCESSAPLVPTSIYQDKNLTHSQKDMSPTVSPPIQVMDRSGRYDPSRIPSSVFEKSGNPMEWSLASNESLFSLQLGQPSLSREKVMYELRLSGESTKSGELDMYNLAPSVIMEEPDTARKSVDVENLQTTETSHEAFKLEEERLSEDQNEIKTLHQTASSKSSKSNASSPSHKSGTREHSGASPLKKRSRTLGYCSNCSWVFCNCKFPACKCLQSCWVFSCCWNKNRTESRDHASPILTEAERNDSMKADIPRQQSKQASEVISKSNANYCNWFRCFSSPSCTKLSCTMCKCCS